jgi:hypothetical protein
MRTGAVGHNGFKSDFDMGHGGFKQSGIGREGGIDGLLPFLESKAMLLDGPTSRYTSVLLSPGGTTPKAYPMEERRYRTCSDQRGKGAHI